MGLVLKTGVKFYGFAGIHWVIFVFLFARNCCFNISDLLFQLWNLFFEEVNLFEGQILLICWRIGRELGIQEKVPWGISWDIVFVPRVFLREGIDLKGRVPRVAFLIFIVN